MADINFGLDRTIAHMDGVRAAVIAEAIGVGFRAEALLAEHRRTGHAEVVMDEHNLDALVWLVDPAALSIEFGRGPNADGRGAMEGLHILGRAAGL